MKVCLFLALFAYSSLSTATLPDIKFVGASNTAGYGASMPLGTRLEHHLIQNSSAAQIEKINQANILVSFDIFYPTRFVKLSQPNVILAA